MLLAEYGEEYGQDNADDDTCGERKVKAELFSLNKDIPRQTSNVGNFVGKHKPEPDNNEQHTNDYEHPA